MVANCNTSNTLADRLDNASTLVSEDAREQALVG
jgi:hypothetical protein